MSARMDVVNFALTILGQAKLTKITDDSDVARAMLNLYYIARDAVLEEAEWTFATRRFTPAKSSAAPRWGWLSAFPIPSDIIRVTQVDRDITVTAMITDVRQNRNPVDHVVEFVQGIGGKGMAILCDEEEIFCKGVRRIEDEGIYSPLFVEAFACKLAYLAGYAIPESGQKLQVALALYTDALRKAKTRDGMQNSTRRTTSRSLSNAR